MHRAALLLFLILFTAALGLTAACSRTDNTPPRVEQKPETLEIHGDVRIDNYYWLRDRDNPDVIAYLDAENAYTEAAMAGTAGLRERLVKELRARIQENDSTAPYRHGEYFYYRRYDEGLEYPIYVRRKGSMNADEEILLDVNALAGDEPYFAVSGFRVSPDHKTAGFGVDTVGRRFYTLRFIDLETGEEIADRIENVTPNFVWADDSRTIFYTKQNPDTLRWQWIYRASTDSDEHELVYEEADITFSLYVYKSLSGQYLYIASGSTTANEVRYIPSDAPASEPALFLPREDDHEYLLTDGGDRFFVTSNDNAQNFQLFEVPLENTMKEMWSVVVPHRDDVLIQYPVVFANHVVVHGRRNGLPYTEIIDRNSGESHVLEYGEEAFDAGSGSNYEYASQVYRYQYESMTTPDSDYDYDMATKDRTLVRQQQIPGGFNPGDYMTERLTVTARDGTKVPVSLVYRRDTEMDGEAPLLQYGYGSYGASIDPWFSSTRLSLLDRGFIFAIAHIRGGSEMGRHWYLDGRQLDKKNTFYDFIDVSRHLIEQGYTSPEHLYAEGASAGGLLMGAVVNMAPELYNGVIAGVPFVDVITTMLDKDIPLTALEFEEWGNPEDKEFYDYMLSYSPYDQVERKDYPNMLITSGLHDSQVQYWEPTKWVAKLREYKTDDNMLLLRTDMESGHSGKTGRFNYLQDVAFEWGFLLALEGINE